jgi:hypothetical protein
MIDDMDDADDLGELPPINFDESPVPGVAVEAIRYVLTLPEETRKWLGNFILDSTLEGFDGTPERCAGLWTKELQRRIDEAEKHPERCIPADVFLEQMKRWVEELERTPIPDNLHGYHCSDYFGGGLASRGYFDESAQYWLIEPLKQLHSEQRLGFFAIGGPGVDGIRFGYRFGKKGVWAFYPMTEKFVFMADTPNELIEGWKSGKLSV